MKHIPAITQPNKYLYYDFSEGSIPDVILVFLSGFSGSRDFPFLQNMSQMFLKKGFSVLRLNFCTDPEDTIKYPNAFELSDINFSLYEAELFNILKCIPAKKYVFIGHSFGAVIFTHFLTKNHSYQNKTELVFWEPSLLPWNQEEFLRLFPFDYEKSLYVSLDTTEQLNQNFYTNITTIDSIQEFSQLNKNSLIISAKGSCDAYAAEYFKQIKNTEYSKNTILEKTDHCFSDTLSQKKLFEQTLEFVLKSCM